MKNFTFTYLRQQDNGRYLLIKVDKSSQKIAEWWLGLLVINRCYYSRVLFIWHKFVLPWKKQQVFQQKKEKQHIYIYIPFILAGFISVEALVWTCLFAFFIELGAYYHCTEICLDSTLGNRGFKCSSSGRQNTLVTTT